MKRKILACVLACATLFLGMGYAYWTDSLQIDTTATTGELEVKFVDLALFGQYGNEENGWAIFNGIDDNIINEDGELDEDYFDRDENYNIIARKAQLDAYQESIKTYTKTTFGAVLADPITTVPPGVDGTVYDGATNVSDGINLNLNNIYPGYAQLFRTDILNTGTLAARLADIDLVVNSVSNNDIKDMIGVSLKVLRENEQIVKVFNFAGLTENEFFTVGGEKFVRLSFLDTAALDNIINDILYIYPGDNTIDVYLGVAMDGDYDGDYTTGHVGLANTGNYDVNTQNAQANFTLKFGWDQFNTKLDPDAPVAE